MRPAKVHPIGPSAVGATHLPPAESLRWLQQPRGHRSGPREASCAVPGAAFVGNSTKLFDLIKGDVVRSLRHMDINRIGLVDIAQLPDSGLRIAALARNSEVANHPLLRTGFPLLTQGLLASMSAQLRNRATMGADLPQRPRCSYFVDTVSRMSIKRAPGTACGTREDVNRLHAILRTRPACIAVAPSDMDVAPVALDAVVQVLDPNGNRSIPVAGVRPSQPLPRDPRPRKLGVRARVGGGSARHR